MPHCVIEISNQLSSSVTPTQLLRFVFDAHVRLVCLKHTALKCAARAMITILQAQARIVLSMLYHTSWQGAQLIKNNS